MNAFDGISHLTFDCYGTLIDWESGILTAVRPLLCGSPAQPTAESILDSYAVHEARIESGPWKPYRDVLRLTLAAIADDFGVELHEGQVDLLSETLPEWKPFPDVVAALKRLECRYRLAIVSNTDDALFAATSRHLPIQFAAVVTAEQVRSYKPGRAHFDEVLRRLGVPVRSVLHVAQSLYHDHVPARALGFQTAQIHRPHSRRMGLAPADAVQPDLVAVDLGVLADTLMR